MGWFLNALDSPASLGGFHALKYIDIVVGGMAVICYANNEAPIRIGNGPVDEDETPEIIEALAAILFGFTDIPLVADL